MKFWSVFRVTVEMLEHKETEDRRDSRSQTHTHTHTPSHTFNVPVSAPFRVIKESGVLKASLVMQ